ncbi:MAG: prolyl oligopeptidase family serine peptidase [Anaerolineae bacterium]|nr:prolyl oligopeptidase family serine peptidase [Anaerolineae bacterium]
MNNLILTHKKYMVMFGLLVWLLLPVTAITQAQSNVRQVGLVSTRAECVVVDGRRSGDTFTRVQLEWNGPVDDAFLVLSASGSTAAHTIYVNGQPVAIAPIQPDGQPCSNEFSQHIPIPPDVLVQGENDIFFTNDADLNNTWTAADIQIEIRRKADDLGVASLDVGTMGSIQSAVLTSSYDSASHTIYFKTPDTTTYTTPAPLVVVLHGLGGTGLGALYTELTTEASQRGWLLVAPNQHNRVVPYNGDSDGGKKALAWLGAQHDVIDAIDYMTSHFSVNKSRIFVIGGSMGGQTTLMMAGKYPDVFGAAVPWKPLTDLGELYGELDDDSFWAPNPDDPYLDLPDPGIHKQVGGTPSEVPFEYARRSPRNLAPNMRTIPLKMWHDTDDIFVKPHHSQDMKSAIDAWSPLTPVQLTLVPSGALDCPTNVIDFRDSISGNGLPVYELEHCYNPLTAAELDALFDFLQSHPRSSSPPATLNIRTDESKAFYWLNIVRPNNSIWSQVDVTYNASTKSVIASNIGNITTLGFNLGANAITGPAQIAQAGMQIPGANTTYLLKKGSSKTLVNYGGSGYLNVAVDGNTSLSLSAISIQVTANPDMIPDGGSVNSTVTATVTDQLGNPAANGTQVQFTTTAGTFSGGGTTFFATIAGGQGKATAILNTNQRASVTAKVQMVTGSVIVGPEELIYLPVVLRP